MRTIFLLLFIAVTFACVEEELDLTESLPEVIEEEIINTTIEEANEQDLIEIINETLEETIIEPTPEPELYTNLTTTNDIFAAINETLNYI